MKWPQRLLKRTFDAVFAFVGCVVFSVPMFIIACLIKASSRGPVFFSQQRVGQNGKPFTLIKFRTMRVGADAFGPITTVSDKRITGIGGILRKYKLDELPQLWNVLTGAMSFVGPRPDVAGYADRLTGENRKILELKPGITGPASLYFRDEERILAKVENPREYNDTILWPKKVELNLDYYKNRGFWKDIGYIIITALPPFDRVFKLLPPEQKGRGAVDNG
jgi:lipopolysaccharide/colanic/teichoic acid biosynthesis glycosyltransferase